MIRFLFVFAIAAVFMVEPAAAQEAAAGGGFADQATSFWSDIGLGFMTELVPTSVLVIGFGIYKVLQIAAKLIPNEATGFLGIVRKVAKVASGYVSNRQKPGDAIS